MPADGLRGIGARSAAKLGSIGIVSISGILTRYPKDYEDRSKTIPLRDYALNMNVCTTARVLEHANFRFKGELRKKIIIEDDTARAVIPCFFKGDYLAKSLFVGGDFRISGHFERNKFGELQSTKIDFEPADAPISKFGGILPIYYYSDSERNKLLRSAAKSALTLYAGHIEDELPLKIIKSENLLSKTAALHAIHFPASEAELDAARRTLIFEELFYLEVMVGLRRGKRKEAGGGNLETGSGQSNLLATCNSLSAALQARLPFKLTEGQKSAIADINRDITSGYPMARLLQGDVGSGKTLVAFFAALAVIERGGQAALMAPTELLARQHAENAALLLEPIGIRVAFLTGNIKQAGRAHLLAALANGEIDLIVGTHALFSRDVRYKNLALAVIDEQHRFGVTQREAILEKGRAVTQEAGGVAGDPPPLGGVAEDRPQQTKGLRRRAAARGGTPPHLLMMSATPIPRTLAMTVFGDMDVSVIRDMPPGRKPVITHLARGENEERVYSFVRAELAAGRQAYFVYPLIESGELDLKDAESMHKRLSSEVFPEFSAELLHSRVQEDEKRTIMERFRRGETRILVATSVVEVGVDVPNATCMVIEHAERFGLSALHQLRGRVGRGKYQSYCFLIYAQNDGARFEGTAPELLSDEERSREGKRLMVMLRENDGFVIAEEDLKFRGPGEIAGTEQSGFMRLGISDPLRDQEALIRARELAFAMLDADPNLQSAENAVVGEVLARAMPFGG